MHLSEQSDSPFGGHSTALPRRASKFGWVVMRNSNQTLDKLPIEPRSMLLTGHGRRVRVLSTVLIVPLLMSSWFVVPAFGKQSDTAGAKVAGAVFVGDSEGKQSFVAGATVKLTGPVVCETQTARTEDMR
jgi:hypothetical protein